MMRFELGEKGSVFSTRDRGIRLVAEVEASCPSSEEPLVLDFGGVHNVSDSFADEFVVTLVRSARERRYPDPELERMSPFVENVVVRALRDRGIKLVDPVSA